MRKIVSFWKIVVFDTIGVAFMIVAVLTGWLPGPGGIPLFIIGLSMLAINHAWAKRYIDFLKHHADRLSDYVFVKNPKVQIAYDVMVIVLISLAIALFWKHSAWWMISAGVSSSFLAIALYLGNRSRWQKLKSKFTNKQ